MERSSEDSADACSKHDSWSKSNGTVAAAVESGFVLEHDEAERSCDPQNDGCPSELHASQCNPGAGDSMEKALQELEAELDGSDVDMK